jgi:hypothetical protein
MAEGEAKRIHNEAGPVGAWFPAGDAEGAAKWIYEAKENIDAIKLSAKDAREFVIRNYNREEGVGRLNDILLGVLEEAKGNKT